MKKVSSIFMIALTAWMLQGCGGNASNDSKASADSANMAKDSSAKDSTHTSDSAKTAGSTMAAPADDAKFATMAANGGMTEVQLSKLAESKSTNAQVKSFAAMMVKDHTKAGDELTALAKSKNITLPATLDNDSQKKVNDLSAKSGSDFDKAYVDMMLDDHKKTVDAFEDASKNLKDPDLKAFVDKTLPTLRMHLDAIKKIHDQVK